MTLKAPLYPQAFSAICFEFWFKFVGNPSPYEISFIKDGEDESNLNIQTLTGLSNTKVIAVDFLGLSFLFTDSTWSKTTSSKWIHLTF